MKVNQAPKETPETPVIGVPEDLLVKLEVRVIEDSLDHLVQMEPRETEAFQVQQETREIKVQQAPLDFKD